MNEAEKLAQALQYALAQYNSPGLFSPFSNHWAAVASNALGAYDAHKAANESLAHALLNPKDLGHAATPEIRDRAKQVLDQEARHD